MVRILRFFSNTTAGPVRDSGRRHPSSAMSHFKTSAKTLYFNTRDEVIKVRLDRVMCFEADANYCHVTFVNGARATLLTSLVNIETLINDYNDKSEAVFIRIGKRYIVNSQYIFRINIPRQLLALADFEGGKVVELNVSKEALRNLKQLYTNK